MKPILKFSCIFLAIFIVMFIVKHEHTALVDYYDANIQDTSKEQYVEEEDIEDMSVSLSDGKGNGTSNKKPHSNSSNKNNSSSSKETVDKQENNLAGFDNNSNASGTTNNKDNTQQDKHNNVVNNDKEEYETSNSSNTNTTEKETVKDNNEQSDYNDNVPSTDDGQEGGTNIEMPENKEEIKDNFNYQTPFEIVANMKAGINIGNSLDAYGNKYYEDIKKYETQWNNPVITESLLKFIKQIGFNTVRIPVTWDVHLKEDGTIDKRWFERVKQVVDYAYKYDMYVIINVHHDKWYNAEYSNLYNGLKKTELVWTQIAEYFKDYDSHLIFEGFNEPRIMCGDSDIEFGIGNPEAYDVINQFNSKFVEVVRNTGGNNKVRALMISGYCAGSDKKVLDSLHIPDDDNLILSCHFYAPHKFTSENYPLSSWSPTDFASTSNMDYKLNTMYKFSQYNNIPVVVTEFGATDKYNLYCREEWTKYFVNRANKYGIAYVWWDNNCYEDTYGLYGIIDRKKKTIKFPTIIKILTGYSN